MVEWTEGDVPVNGTNIHYYRMGQQGKSPVVLLHGFTDSGLCWMRLATDLGDDYDLVMIDAVGHGKSGGLEHGFRARAVSDVIAVIEALGLERPALVGHSMGAGTAAGVAAESGDQIRAIALEDPGWRDTPPPPVAESRPAVETEALVERNRQLKQLSPEERYAWAAAERPAWSEIDRTHWADAKAQLNPEIYKEQNAPRPPWRDTVRRITAPVLLITADNERGAIVTPAMAEEAAKLWRTGQIVHIPGAGHNIRREQYEPFRAAVTAFLAETAG